MKTIYLKEIKYKYVHMSIFKTPIYIYKILFTDMNICFYNIHIIFAISIIITLRIHSKALG